MLYAIFRYAWELYDKAVSISFITHELVKLLIRRTTEITDQIALLQIDEHPSVFIDEFVGRVVIPVTSCLRELQLAWTSPCIAHLTRRSLPFLQLIQDMLSKFLPRGHVVELDVAPAVRVITHAAYV